MISVRVKTPNLEIAASSDATSNLAEVVEAVIKVGKSEPIQSGLQSPVILRSLPAPKAESPTSQLPLFLEDKRTTAERIQSEDGEPKKKLARGKGERTVAYNKIIEMIPKGFFNGDGKGFAEIQKSLATLGHSISDGKLADTLLKLTREGHLVREGERRSYVYKTPPTQV